MKEQKNDIFSTEHRILEYWRKRYLFQAFIVFIVIATLLLFLYANSKNLNLKLLLGLMGLAIFNLMYKALQEGLQIRTEELFLRKISQTSNITFDVGRGI